MNYIEVGIPPSEKILFVIFLILTKMRKTLLFLSFLFCFNSSFSQDKKKKITKFSEEITVFIGEMDEFINTVKNKD